MGGIIVNLDCLLVAVVHVLKQLFVSNDLTSFYRALRHHVSGIEHCHLCEAGLFIRRPAFPFLGCQLFITLQLTSMLPLHQCGDKKKLILIGYCDSHNINTFQQTCSYVG